MFDPRRDLRRHARRLPLDRRPAQGHTRRPRGSAGAGARNLIKDQWAQSRFFGYPDSQLPPLDRPRNPAVVPSGAGPPLEPLLNDGGVACTRSQYTVSIAGAELGLADPFVGQPIPTRQDVLGNGSLVSSLQVRIEWSLGAGRDNRMDLDIGAGFQLSLPAVRVQMSLLLPAGAIDLEPLPDRLIPLPPVDPVTGLAPNAWLAALLWGTVNRTQTFSAVSEWQLTRALFVPATQSLTLRIPESADFVEAYETSGAGMPTPFLNFTTEAGSDVGQWSESGTRPRRFERVRIPGTAKFINSGPVNQAQDRLFSFVFTVRP